MSAIYTVHHMLSGQDYVNRPSHLCVRFFTALYYVAPVHNLPSLKHVISPLMSLRKTARKHTAADPSPANPLAPSHARGLHHLKMQS